MKNTQKTATSLLTLGAFALSQAPASAQAVSTEAEFAQPVRIMAGDKFLGAQRAYPSPAFHDVNGDGQMDILIADLPGRVTVALGSSSKTSRFGAEKPLLGKDKKQLDFGNW